MEYALSELFTLQMGKTPSRDNSSYWGKSENNWISIADLTNSGKYISNTKETLSDSAVAESGIKKIPANTVIMSFKLSLGKVAITEKEMYSNEAIMAFIDKGVEKISPEYLYYLLRAKDWSKGTNKAVMGATLNKATLSTIKIQLHEYDNQLEIVNMLNRVSSSIDFRKQQLTKLDELIKARFVEMFGDPSINPMGWFQTTIGQECYSIKDGPHKSLMDVGKENGHPFISVRNIVKGYIDFSTAKYISDVDYKEAIKKCCPEKGDILYSKGGTTGIAKLVDVDIKFANWVHLAVLKFNHSEFNGTFFENMLNCDYCYSQSQMLTKGIANRDLVLSAMAQIKIYKPPILLQNQFAAFVEEVDKSKVEVQKALDQTQLLFDSLMQQYFR